MYDKQKDFGVKYANLAKIQNFRDLGGIEVNNRSVKHGKIFRSGALCNLTDDEKAQFDKLDIRHIFDFRSINERETEVDYVPSFADYYPMPVIREEAFNLVNRADVENMLRSGDRTMLFEYIKQFKQLYREMPFNNPSYAKMFSVMDSGDSFLFHCSAGKDRTGVASMLILLSLGADFETARLDYMTTTLYREKYDMAFTKMLRSNGLPEDVIEVLNDVIVAKAEYIESSYDEITKRYQSVDEFFEKEYGASRSRRDNWIKIYTE